MSKKTPYGDTWFENFKESIRQSLEQKQRREKVMCEEKSQKAAMGRSYEEEARIKREGAIKQAENGERSAKSRVAGIMKLIETADNVLDWVSPDKATLSEMLSDACSAYVVAHQELKKYPEAIR